MRAGLLLLTAAGLSLAVVPIEAQRGPAAEGRVERVGPASRPAGPALGRSIEAALRQRDRLGLSDEQVVELEAIRSELDAALAPMRDEASALRSEAGTEATSPEARRELRRGRMDNQRALRARIDTVTASFQARFERVVPPLQRWELQRAARGQGGVRGLRADRGVRGIAGARAVRPGDGLRPGRGRGPVVGLRRDGPRAAPRRTPERRWRGRADLRGR